VTCVAVCLILSSLQTTHFKRYYNLTYLIGLIIKQWKLFLYVNVLYQYTHTEAGAHIPVLELREAWIFLFTFLIASAGKRLLLTR